MQLEDAARVLRKDNRSYKPCECCIKTTKKLTDHMKYISVVKKQRKKSQSSIYHYRYRKPASYAKNNPMCTPRDVISPECVYISMICALTVVHHVVLAWRGSWFASGVAPMGGNPRFLFTDTPSDFSLEYSSGYALVTLKSNYCHS